MSRACVAVTIVRPQRATSLPVTITIEVMDKPEPDAPTAVEGQEGRTERIAVMRHELADLQRQLIDAQGRIAVELQGRAEDADRFEELEARARGLEVKAREDAARLEELHRELAARDARIEESRREHRELTEQLENHVASLRDTKALLAAAGAELETTLAARDTERATRTRLEGDLEEARRALDAGRARAQELAKQITTLGQALDTVMTDERRGAHPPRSAAEPPSASAPPIEAKPEAAVEPPKESAPSRARALILVLGGIAVGVAVTFAIVELRGSRETDPTPPPDLAGATPASSRGADAVGDSQPAAPTSPASAQTEVAGDASTSGTAPSADAQRTGIIVLPPDADGHRIFVDGRRLQPANGRIEVPCGKREIQIGSRGEPRLLDIACGGETAVR